MEELIGNTPMIKIDYEYRGRLKSVYAKLEQYNLTGSIKDRVAYYMIIKAKEQRILKDGMPIIEATSGNTGISLAALGVYYNHPVYIFMPDWVSSKRLKIMKLYGANVTLFSKEEGGFKRCIQEANKLAKNINGYYIDQFSNTNNILAHYETTGKEIINQLSDIGWFVTGIGTGISSGANLIAAIMLNESIEGNMVTVFADDSKKYLSSDLNKEIDENKLFISNQINLMTYLVTNK